MQSCLKEEWCFWHFNFSCILLKAISKKEHIADLECFMTADIQFWLIDKYLMIWVCLERLEVSKIGRLCLGTAICIHLLCLFLNLSKQSCLFLSSIPLTSWCNSSPWAGGNLGEAGQPSERMSLLTAYHRKITVFGSVDASGFYSCPRE